MQDKDSDKSLLKDDSINDLKELYNLFTEYTRTGKIRRTLNHEILNTILDLIVTTIDEFQDDTSKNSIVIRKRIDQLRNLIELHNDYIKH